MRVDDVVGASMAGGRWEQWGRPPPGKLTATRIYFPGPKLYPILRRYRIFRE